MASLILTIIVFQVMPGGGNSLPEPMLTYCQVAPQKHTSVIF